MPLAPRAYIKEASFRGTTSSKSHVQQTGEKASDTKQSQ